MLILMKVIKSNWKLKQKFIEECEIQNTIVDLLVTYII